mmetsp:Transcript_18908/g.36568  ORF Transcript_18908/g.36568 Transcript_18908/m.36568 type:complete len:140 (+) Transcript_18908:121-540(+)
MIVQLGYPVHAKAKQDAQKEHCVVDKARDKPSQSALGLVERHHVMDEYARNGRQDLHDGYEEYQRIRLAIAVRNPSQRRHQAVDFHYRVQWDDREKNGHGVDQHRDSWFLIAELCVEKDEVVEEHSRHDHPRHPHVKAQ